MSKTFPKGATNKDIFKAVFGYEPATDAVVCNKKDWCGASEPCNYCTSNPDNVGREEEWWNAPYKSESEELTEIELEQQSLTIMHDIGKRKIDPEVMNKFVEGCLKNAKEKEKLKAKVNEE